MEVTRRFPSPWSIEDLRGGVTTNVTKLRDRASRSVDVLQNPGPHYVGEGLLRVDQAEHIDRDSGRALNLRRSRASRTALRARDKTDRGARSLFPHARQVGLKVGPLYSR